jgi:hypothetical protein
MAWRGKAWRGRVGLGAAWQARPGWERRGLAWCGRVRQAWHRGRGGDSPLSSHFRRPPPRLAGHPARGGEGRLAHGPRRGDRPMRSHATGVRLGTRAAGRVDRHRSNARRLSPGDRSRAHPPRVRGATESRDAAARAGECARARNSTRTDRAFRMTGSRNGEAATAECGNLHTAECLSRSESDSRLPFFRAHPPVHPSGPHSAKAEPSRRPSVVFATHTLEHAFSPTLPKPSIRPARAHFFLLESCRTKVRW